MSFVLDWQKKLGYRTDPFVERPARRVAEYLVNRRAEQERLNLFIIKQERFGIIRGERGSGKSLLLEWLAQQLRWHFLTLPVVLLKGSDDLEERLLAASLNVIERTITKPHENLRGEKRRQFLMEKIGDRRLLILVDDAERLTREKRELLRRILAHCGKARVILALEESRKEEELSRNELRITLKEMTNEELKEVLARRIALAGGVGTHPFDDHELSLLIGKAKKNPASLLSLARDRAIELSLRAGPPPKREKKEVGEEARKEKKGKEAPEKEGGKSEDRGRSGGEGKPRAGRNESGGKGKEGEKRVGGRWLSFKIISESEKEKKGEERARERTSIPDPAEDLALLNEVVTKTAGSEEGEEKVEVEDVIETITKEMEKNKKKR